MTTLGPPPLPGGASSPITIQESLLDRAKQGDAEAITTMFRQFLCEDEQVLTVEYLGVRGFWVFGEHCWGCVTERRAGSLRVGKAGEVVYQDALLEGINSCAIYQPSMMALYIGIGLLILLAIPSFGGALLLIPVAIHVFYRNTKCGLAFVVREGLNVYMFTNRKRLTLANRIYRRIMEARERRVEALGLHVLAARA